MARVACAATVMSACATFSRTGTHQTSFPLVVNNRTDFEVVVYAMPSSAASPVRLGNARSFATTTLAIPHGALQPANVLVVQAHCIGAASWVRPWISPAAQLDTGVVAHLEIRADASGDLSRSSLYTEAGSAPPKSGARPK